MLLLGLLLLVCGAVVPGPIPSAAAQGACDGLVAPRLAVGGAARVISPYGLSLKNQPMTGAAGGVELQLLSFGTTVSVLDGPRCNMGYVWWQLEVSGGVTGWAAEGSSTEYFLEPSGIGQPVFVRSDDSSQIIRYTVTSDGSVQQDSAFQVTPYAGTPQDSWQQVEIDRLRPAFEAVLQGCPDRLQNTVFANVTTTEAALALLLPPLEYDFYPSPDGSRLVLVRHLHLQVPRCSTVVPERIGISVVSLLDLDGTETVLFPFPQHGNVPASEDRYQISEPGEWTVYLDEVVWSPQGKYIAFVAAYQDACGGQGCYRFHMYIWNTETGQLYVPGEGRHVGWTNGGEGINYFRLLFEGDNQQKAHLYTMRPDGSARQEIWLPGGAEYVSSAQRGLGLPWNASGTRVMVYNAGRFEVMLFNLTDRTFSPPIALPDLMPAENRLSVQLVQGESMLLWTTIRGDFVTQNVKTGQWTRLTSAIGGTGLAPHGVMPFPVGSQVLVQMQTPTAFILDYSADRLTPLAFVE